MSAVLIASWRGEQHEQEASGTRYPPALYLLDTGKYGAVVVNWDMSSINAETFVGLSNTINYILHDSAGNALVEAVAQSGVANPLRRVIYFGALAPTGGPTNQIEFVGRFPRLSLGYAVTGNVPYLLTGNVEVWGLP